MSNIWETQIYSYILYMMLHVEAGREQNLFVG